MRERIEIASSAFGLLAMTDGGRARNDGMTCQPSEYMAIYTYYDI